MQTTETFNSEVLANRPGMIVLEKKLQEWIKQFPERGSTWQAVNQLGDAFVTFSIFCKPWSGIIEGIKAMKNVIRQEAKKTGIISIRSLPEIIEDNGQYKVVARIVSYRGNLSDSLLGQWQMT